MIKALFFDIDGTLVSITTHRIPESTLDALEEAKRRGVKIFISTGRPPIIITCLKQMDERNLIDGYVTMNGAYCFVGNKLLYKSCIEPKDARTIVEFCDTYRLACIEVGEHSICCHPHSQLIDDIFFHQLNVDVPIPEVSMEESLNQELFQVTPFINLEQEQELAPQLHHCEIGRWHPAFVDITSKGNTKELGLQHIMAHFGLKREEVMAFGDGGNDIPMIQFAGIGVAMGNARPHVKEVADYVTTDVDDNGISNALHHFQVI